MRPEVGQNAAGGAVGRQVWEVTLQVLVVEFHLPFDGGKGSGSGDSDSCKIKRSRLGGGRRKSLEG